MKTKLLLFFAVLMMAFGANAQVTSVALVGEAAGGWPGDPGNPGPTDIHQMTSTDGVNWTLEGITLTTATSGGGVKFRANNAWTTNWGAAEFPSGTGVANGPNILCIAGTYDVTFNSDTGVYNFSGGAPIPVVKLVGAAVSEPEGISLSTLDLANFTVSNKTLLDGNAQFEIDGVLYGAASFPTGTAESDGLIPVVAGTYSTISINIESGEYTFTAAPVFPSIAIVGSGAGGWPSDPQIDANVLTTSDGITYKGVKIALTAGEIKFRENNAWTVSYGGTGFPSGTASNDNIVVTTPGTYDVTFDRPTGAYTFSIPTIALVGPGASGWPSDPQIDTFVLSTNDGVTYSGNFTLTDGDVKFRQNNGWDVNYGAADFPSGTATQGGANIPAVAGSYTVTLDRVTGAYNFGTLSTPGFTKSNFNVYPNPTNTVWNFSSNNDTITSIKVVDVLCKVVATSNQTSLDATALNKGVYFAVIATDSQIATVKVIKN
jgi:starch-binding outer membrane protein SusE/F